MAPLPRGGAYTYDWIENLLGLNMHSVDRVLPEYQHPQIGDTIGYGSNQMRVERVEHDHVLSWRSEDGNWVWTFVIKSGEDSTRLIAATAFACLARRPTWHGSHGARVACNGVEDAAGIKVRAESLDRQRSAASED